MSTRVSEMPLTELVALVNEWGTLPRELDPEGRHPGALTPLADELHPIFASPEPTERAQLITRLLKTSRVRPELTTENNTLIESWTVDDPSQAVRAAAALALRHHLAHHQGRLGVCADLSCADVYIDSSPAGRRRFCCLTCQNRARAAAFRARHRPS